MPDIVEQSSYLILSEVNMWEREEGEGGGEREREREKEREREREKRERETHRDRSHTVLSRFVLFTT